MARKLTYEQWLSSLCTDDYNWYYAMYNGNMKLAYEKEYTGEYK